jgi:hypothetical protein
MFQEALQFKNDIIFCYDRQNTVKISGKVHPLFIWHIKKIIVDFLFHVVATHVLNQSSTHWLLSNAL